MSKTFGHIMAVCILTGLGLTVSVTASSAQPSPTRFAPFAGEFHPIKNVGTTLCLEPRDKNPNFDVPIVQAHCDGSSAQGWAALDMGNNHYRFLNPDGWCINVGGELANGVQVQQDECKAPGQDSVSDAEWLSSARLPNVVTLRSRLHDVNSNFCLSAPVDQATPVIRVQGCDGSLAQRWVVDFD
jgi:hypothetical protein